MGDSVVKLTTEAQMVNETPQVLIDQIQIAFAHVPQPSVHAVVVPTRDDEGTEECFSGKRVADIPDERFVKLCTALWFFTDEALLYYLPGFMRAVL
jgi:hypothetical protein